SDNDECETMNGNKTMEGLLKDTLCSRLCIFNLAIPGCLVARNLDDDSDYDNSDASFVRWLGRYDNNNGIESNRNRRMEERETIAQNEVTSGSDVRETESRSSYENVSTPATLNYSISTMTNSLYGDHEFEVENLGLRDNNAYADLLEHRSNFLNEEEE
nr:hypothetical protein [Tanacetum cinerariifolium]